jgi:hypothetical protein
VDVAYNLTRWDYYVRFEVLTMVNIKFAVFWGIVVFQVDVFREVF